MFVSHVLFWGGMSTNWTELSFTVKVGALHLGLLDILKEVRRGNLPFTPFCHYICRAVIVPPFFFLGLAKNFFSAWIAFFGWTCTPCTFLCYLSHSKCLATVICTVHAETIQWCNRHGHSSPWCFSPRIFCWLTGKKEARKKGKMDTKRREIIEGKEENVNWEGKRYACHFFETAEILFGKIFLLCLWVHPL